LLAEVSRLQYKISE
jgi:hypothetical protein